VAAVEAIKNCVAQENYGRFAGKKSTLDSTHD